MKIVFVFLLIAQVVLLDTDLIKNTIPCISATAKRTLNNIYSTLDPADRQFLHDILKEAVDCELKKAKENEEQVSKNNMKCQILGLQQQVYLQQQQQQQQQQSQQQQNSHLLQQQSCDESWMGKMWESISLTWNAIATLTNGAFGTGAFVYRQKYLALQHHVNADVEHGRMEDADENPESNDK